jgi:hypothetical protein
MLCLSMVCPFDVMWCYLGCLGAGCGLSILRLVLLRHRVGVEHCAQIVGGCEHDTKPHRARGEVVFAQSCLLSGLCQA